MNALSLVTSALKNFQPTTSVLAGGASSILVCAIGAILVAAGVAIPPIGILGLTAATPLTMTMVMSAAVPIGHVVTALVPDSVNQQLNGLAQKLQVDVEKLRSFIPQEYYSADDFPHGRNGA
ncbi:MAG: hypothetical protein KGI37_06635 [Alphaproteobacteria bacterium]|nr:hypothetical protein [Alphaproteobacteria bacterium]